MHMCVCMSLYVCVYVSPAHLLCIQYIYTCMHVCVFHTCPPPLLASYHTASHAVIARLYMCVCVCVCVCVCLTSMCVCSTCPPPPLAPYHIARHAVISRCVRETISCISNLVI